MLKNEDAYFYLNALSQRIEKLCDLNNQYQKDKNIEKAIDSLRPPIFWKDKPTFYKQIKNWNLKKLEEAKQGNSYTENNFTANIDHYHSDGGSDDTDNSKPWKTKANPDGTSRDYISKDTLEENR